MLITIVVNADKGLRAKYGQYFSLEPGIPSGLLPQ
jgi:hypothetical protein